MQGLCAWKRVASPSVIRAWRPHEPHARGTPPTISAVCLCVSMRSARLRHTHAVRPVALGIQACLHCGVPLPALRQSAEHGRDHAYLLQRPQSPSMCRSPYAGALRLSLVLIHSAPSIRVCWPPFAASFRGKGCQGFHHRHSHLSLSRLSCKCIQGLANRELRHKRWRPRCLLASEARQA
jgi:hypothetical protein